MDPVINFAATPGDQMLILGWKAPGNPDFAGVRIQWTWPDASGFPADYLQGWTIAEVSGVPGGAYSYVMTTDYFGNELTNGETYYLGCFAYNEAQDDWAAADPSAEDYAIPRSMDIIPVLSGVLLSDFESGVSWGTSCLIFDQIVGDIEIPLIPEGEVS